MNYRENYSVRQSLDSVNSIQPELSWWIKITTAKPGCIYYFGPFDRRSEAAVAQYGYLEDLTEEKASGINIEIKRDNPKLLTISA